jgi:DNA repair photolyase
MCLHGVATLGKMDIIRRMLPYVPSVDSGALPEGSPAGSAEDGSSRERASLVERIVFGGSFGYRLALYHPRAPRAAVARRRIPEQLDALLQRRGFERAPILFGDEAECYPHEEVALGLTRSCLDVCLRRRAPVALLTRSPLIERDLDLVRRLAIGPGLSAAVGLQLFDADRARSFEKGVASPLRRLEMIARLAKAQIPTVVAIAPAVWGITDTDLVRLLTAARDAGARGAHYRRLRLAPDAVPRFVEHVRRTLPDRARRVIAGLRRAPRQDGPEDAMQQIFEYTAVRLGMEIHRHGPWPTDPAAYAALRSTDPQLSLFS